MQETPPEVTSLDPKEIIDAIFGKLEALNNTETPPERTELLSSLDNLEKMLDLAVFESEKITHPFGIRHLKNLVSDAIGALIKKAKSKEARLQQEKLSMTAILESLQKLQNSLVTLRVKVTALNCIKDDLIATIDRINKQKDFCFSDIQSFLRK